MIRLLAALLILPGLAACSSERESRALTAPAAYQPAPVGTSTPGTVPPTTKDTLQGVGRPL